MSDLIEKLKNLQPDPTLRSHAPKLSDEEFRAVKVARSKGCSWKQILPLLDGRYKTAAALSVAYKKWYSGASKT